MSNRFFTFEPQDLDFHLRAIALCDYQREILGRRPSDNASTKTEGLNEQHFMWLLGEIINAAYLPLAGSLIEFVDGKYVWAARQKLPNSYHDCLYYANEIFQRISDDEEAKKTLHSSEVVTRKSFFKSIDHIAESVLENAVLRTKYQPLQKSFIEGESLWALIRRDQPGYAPWVIPELCVSDNPEIKYHRFRILQLLNKALQMGVSNFENSARKSEFGTPEISLIKLANFVRSLDHSARSSSSHNDSVSKYQVFSAEVGTILGALKNRLDISNRRHFLVSLADELRSSIGLVEPDQIDVYFFKNSSK